MERLVPEQSLWRSDRWIPGQWTRKSGITFDLLSAVIENRVRRLRRQASRSTRATGRPSSKSTLTAKSYRSMPSSMSTVLPVQIRTGWIMKPRDFAAREDEATNGVCNARSAFEPLPKVDCAKFVFVSSLQADRRIAASRPRESFARQAGNCSGYGGTALGRDRLGCMGVSAAVLLTTSDFDAERVLRPRVGFGSASAEARAVDIGGAVLSVLTLRPRPSSFASADRRSE